MNYIAAFLLLALDRDEEKAFWVMVSLVKDVAYSGTWSKHLSGCLVEMETLATLITKRIPKVAKHFEEMGCDAR